MERGSRNLPLCANQNDVYWLSREGGRNVFRGVDTAINDEDAVPKDQMNSFVANSIANANIVVNSGAPDMNVLRVASNVADTETVTIGADVYEVNVVNTASGDTTAGGSWNNTTDTLTVDITLATYPNLYNKLTVGDQISIGSEILIVTYLNGTLTTFKRGDSGTTTAVHANAVAIKISNGYTAGHIPVGLIATLTPTAFIPAIIAQVNSYGTEIFSAFVQLVNVSMMIYGDVPGPVVLACTETLAGANNFWLSSTTYGGVSNGPRNIYIETRVPLASEVTAGFISFVTNFNPVILSILIIPTATPGIAKAWDGSASIFNFSGGGMVTLNNAGATNWAATDTITLTLSDF